MKKIMIISLLLISHYLFAKIEVKKMNDNKFLIKYNYKGENSQQFRVALPPKGDCSINILSRKTKKSDIFLEKTEPLIQKVDKIYSRNNYFQLLKINPFQKNDEASFLHEEILFEINILGNTRYSKKINDKLSDELAKLSINPEDALNWQLKTKSEIHYADFSASSTWYKFEVSEDGIYKINYQDLENLPIEDIDPERIRIFTTEGKTHNLEIDSNGFEFEEIPIIVNSGDDNSFDANDNIILYAKNRDGHDMNSVLDSGDQYFPRLHMFSPYSQNGVYWLTFTGDYSDDPARIETDDFSSFDISRQKHKTSIRFEEENFFAPNPNLVWYSEYFTGSNNVSKIFNVSIDNLDDSDSQKLRVGLKAENFGNHEMELFVNDVSVDYNSWYSASQVNFPIFSNSLQDGENKIELKIYKNYGLDNIYFDYLNVEFSQKLFKLNETFILNSYEIDEDKKVEYIFENSISDCDIFQVDNFSEVSKINLKSENSFISNSREGTKIFVTANYKSINEIIEVSPKDLTIPNEMNGVIIAPYFFEEEANRLAELHQEFYSKESKVYLLEDIFNQFNAGMPEPNAIRFFLKNILLNFPENSLEYAVLFGSGTVDWRNNSGEAEEKNKIPWFHNNEYSSDEYYMYLQQEYDIEAIIGRIPAKNKNEANIYLEKIENYFYQKGFWKNSTLFVADDDSDQGFHENITESEKDINPLIFKKNILGYEYGYGANGTKPQATSEIISSLNEGQLFWNYYGHSSFLKLGDEGYFSVGDISKLENKNRLTFFVGLGCSIGDIDNFEHESLSTDLLFHENGGIIGSIVPIIPNFSSTSSGMHKDFLENCLNNYDFAGKAIWKAKNNFHLDNNRKFNFLGDPLMKVVPPLRIPNITLEVNQDSIQIFDKIKFSGEFPHSENDIIEINAFDKKIKIVNEEINYEYEKEGNAIFRGNCSLNNNSFSHSFTIPEDVNQGVGAKILAYSYSEDLEYLSYIDSIRIEGINQDVEDNDLPQISLWLEDKDFQSGDAVTNAPILLAEISDENGINITGMNGHHILCIIDDEIINVTDGFSYNLDSSSKGNLSWQLPELEDGNHNLKLLVYDNLNNHNFSEITFETKNSSSITLKNMLTYPNPFEDDLYFTFELNFSAFIEISIYTITGRKIKTLDKVFCNKGFNKIFWDGLDADNDELANNTYFYKITASDSAKSDLSRIGKIIKLD